MPSVRKSALFSRFRRHRIVRMCCMYPHQPTPKKQKSSVLTVSHSSLSLFFKSTLNGTRSVPFKNKKAHYSLCCLILDLIRCFERVLSSTLGSAFIQPLTRAMLYSAT